jgi:hypothetical protein
VTRTRATRRGAAPALAGLAGLLALAALLGGSCAHEAPVGVGDGVPLEVRVLFPADAADKASPSTAGIDSVIVSAYAPGIEPPGALRARAGVAVAPPDSTFRVALSVPPAAAYEIVVEARGVRTGARALAGRGTLFAGVARIESVVAGSTRRVVIALDDAVPRLSSRASGDPIGFRLDWTRISLAVLYRLTESPSGREFTTPDTSFAPPPEPARAPASARGLQPLDYRVRAELATGTATAYSESLRVEPSPLCSVDVDRIDFGTVFVGSARDTVVMIANVGEGTLSGTVAETCNHFAIVSGAGGYALGPGGVRTVVVRFEPAVAGAHVCSLSTGAACPPVVCSGDGAVAPLCAIAPTQVDLGAVPIGGSSDTVVVITNDGGGILDIDVTASCPGFTLVSGAGHFSLGAGEQRFVIVRFDPLAEGAAACTVATGAACPPVVVTGTGERAPSCSVSPESLDFGAVAVGASADAAFTIRNAGGGTLAGSVGAICADFAVVAGDGPYALAAGESTSVAVRFAPSAPGAAACSVAVGAACPPAVCRGVGEAAPLCVVSPESLDFGVVEFGDFADARFTVRNAGGGTLTGSVGAECAHFAVVAGGGGFALAAGESLSATVRFAPSVTGALACSVTTGGACPPVACRGVGDNPILCVTDPASVDFGTLYVGESAERTVTVRNAGAGILSGTIDLDSPCAEFTLPSGGGAYALAADESTSVVVRYAPAAAGSHGCVLRTGPSCQDAIVAGSALDPPQCFVVSTVDQSPVDSLDFGNVPQGSAPVRREFEVSHDGSADLMLDVQIDATSACSGDFTIAKGGGPILLPPDSPHLVIVEFAPTQTGPATCTISMGNAFCGEVVCDGVGDPPAAPACSLSADTLHFGSVAIGSFSDLSFTIANVGQGTLTGSVSELLCSAAFSIVSGESSYALGAGQTHAVVIRYAPTSANPLACTIEPGAACPSNVFCDGMGEPPAACAVSVDTLTFCLAAPGSADRSFTITNTGGGTLAGSVSLPGAGCPNFTLVSGGGAYSLGASASHTVTARYSASTTGTSTCPVETGNALCADVRLVGSFATAPGVCSHAGALDFGIVPVGAFKDLTLTLQNIGSGVLSGSAGVVPDSTCSPAFSIVSGAGAFAVCPGESHPVTVRFTPQINDHQYDCFIDLGTACGFASLMGLAP